MVGSSSKKLKDSAQDLRPTGRTPSEDELLCYLATIVRKLVCSHHNDCQRGFTRQKSKTYCVWFYQCDPIWSHSGADYVDYSFTYS